jgi:hypothetical protein
VGRALSYLLLAAMAAIVLVTYAVIGWTLRRGFDWTDESFVYTLIASNRQTIGEAWGFQHLLHALYTVTGESVLAFRVLRLAGYVLLTVALVWAARFALRLIGIRVARSGWVFIALLAQVGTFLAWSYPPRYLGYNELAAWFAQLGVALILISLAWGSSRPRGATAPTDQPPLWALWALWAGLGGLTTLLVFAKVSSAMLFAAILAVAVLVPNPSLVLWKRLVSLGAGVLAMLALLWVGRVPIGFYLSNAYSLAFDKSVRDAFGHPSTGRLLTTYTDSLRFTGRDVLLPVLLFALAMVAFRWKSRPAADTAWGRVVDVVAWLLGALLVVALVTLPRPDVWAYVGELVLFIGLAGLVGLAILAVDRSSFGDLTPSRSFAVLVAGSAIVATPFVSALGTSNRLAGQFMWAATLWCVVLGVALTLLTRRATRLRSRARALPALIGCAVLVLSALAVRADIAKPYRSGPLLSLETSTSVPALRGVLVSKADAAYIDWVANEGVTLGAAHVPAVVITPFRGQKSYNSLGALYAFNHSGYANPWLGRNWEAAFNSLSLACTKDPPADLFVLQPGLSNLQAPSTAGVKKSFAACGINFPDDFRIVGRHPSSNPGLDLTIWRLKR